LNTGSEKGLFSDYDLGLDGKVTRTININSHPCYTCRFAPGMSGERDGLRPSEKEENFMRIEIISNYYFDRIRINLYMGLEKLNRIVDQEILNKYCDRVVIEEPHWMAQKYGYRSKIELFQAEDEAIRHLQSLGLEKWAKIARIEIAYDEAYTDRELAERFRDNFQASTYLKGRNAIYILPGTTYLGKPEHKWPTFYFLSYIPEGTKLGLENVWHREFVVKTNGRIKKVLGIEALNDLRTAQEHYEELERKYLVQAELNRKRIAKHWPDKKFRDVASFVEVLAQAKEQYRERIYSHRVMRMMCGKGLCRKFKVPVRFKQSRHEKLILGQGLGYWLIKK